MSQGKPGYCKICDHPAAQFLNRKLEQDGEKVFNASRARELAQQLGLIFGRDTWGEHKKHITAPLITHQKAALANPVIVPKTNVGVLEAIRDIGMKNVAEHPEEVTVDHALRAASELNKKQGGVDSVLIAFAKVLSGEQPAEVIVGSWQEVPALIEGEPSGN